MSARVQELFTRRTASYHYAVVRLLAYGWGLRVLLERGEYLRSGIRVLDAGCGTGALTRGLHEIRQRRNLADVTIQAFDLTPAMLDHLSTWASKGGAEIELRQANVLELETLPAEWRDYDLIVSSAMLEYLTPEELVVALRSLAGRLAPGGTVLVCITRRNVLMRWLVGAWWQSRLYTRNQIDEAFRAAGLEPRFRSFPFPAWHLDVWGHVIEFKRPA